MTVIRLGTVLLCGALACASPPAPPPFAARLPAYRDGARFVAVGDLQFTSFLEFWRESNDRERLMVASAIARERPAFVAMTGDLTFDGASPARWADFDVVTAPWRDAGLPAFSAFGNHEYWSGRFGERWFFARFPIAAGRHWYALAFGPLRLIVLDSNDGPLSAGEWREQLRFYERTLAELDADPDVRGVIVLLHHPPYTNSTVTGDERHVQRDFVPPFLRARKTLVMHCGHVHSYERFVRAGKTFVVSGGGGGPRAELSVGARRRHPDDLHAGPAVRDFNYLVYTVGQAGLAAEVKGLPKGGDSFRTLERFELPWAP